MVSPEEWISELLRKDLTVGSTVFTDTAVTGAVARRLGRGATVTTIERITALVIADPQVLAVATDDGRRWFTSRELHDIEERFVDFVTRRDTTAAIDPRAVTAALKARPTLGADQAAAVSWLAASCEPLSVLIGPAGTGKTYTLDTVRTPINELAGGSSVPAHRPVPPRNSPPAPASRPAPCTPCSATSSAAESLDAHALLVVDEAGMADIRTLKPSSTSPPVGAAACCSSATTPDALCRRRWRLRVRRRQRRHRRRAHRQPRQRAEWEQQALAALRNGSVSHAVGAYLDHGRVIVTADAAR